MIKLLTIEGFWDGDTCSKHLNQNLRHIKLTEERTIRFGATTFLSSSQTQWPNTLIYEGYKGFIFL